MGLTELFLHLLRRWKIRLFLEIKNYLPSIDGKRGKRFFEICFKWNRI